MKFFLLTIIIVGTIFIGFGYGAIVAFASKRNEYSIRYRLKYYLMKGIIYFILGVVIFIVGLIFYRSGE